MNLSEVIELMKSEDESTRLKARSLFMRLTKRKCDKGHRYVNDKCIICGREL